MTVSIEVFDSIFIHFDSESASGFPLAKIHTLVVGQLQTNCYIIQSQDHALIIDPGDEPERILRYVRDLKITPSKIIATHTHFDHVLGAEGVRKVTKTPFLIHPDDLPMLQSMQSRVRQFMGFEVPHPPKVDGYVRDGELVKVGDESLRVIHTPGHSPGSISLHGDGYVLTGDALFNQSIGRTDLPGGDLKTLLNSIREKLFKLDDETVVYPGHGPETTIGDEKLANPFVGKTARFNE
jgi:hydroxyacylglutathione hydrolase